MSGVSLLKRTLKFLSNKYILITTVFIIWMLFLDSNTWLIWKLNKEISKTEKSIDYYQNEIEKDEVLLEKLKDPEALEIYAREHFFMKKENEDIFIIEQATDSLSYEK